MTMRLVSLAFDGQIESQKPVETGIPQGSPTSPILFLLYLAPLFKLLDQNCYGASRTPSVTMGTLSTFDVGRAKDNIVEGASRWSMLTC